METSNGAGPSISLVSRRLACENARFRVYLDEIVDERGLRVRDYLSVLPHIADRGGVTGIATLPVRDGRFGLMRMYRHPYGGEGWEIPMGFMDDGETPEKAALRELTEETGLAADATSLMNLGSISPAPSIVGARIRLYAARVLGEDSGMPAHEVGHGRFAFFARDAALQLAQSGAIVEPCTLVALYRYLLASPV